MFRLVLLLLLFPTFVLAQKNIQIKGVVYDTASKKGLAFATVSLVSAKDSTLINFTRADSSGAFVLKQVSKGSYLLSASYVGFIPEWKNINITNETELNLGNIHLINISSSSAIIVQAKRPPVIINGDTLEFNAENFKTQPNAVVEDLLKRLPGVTVDADGTVRVNGQQVNRVLVNGKDFFNGDPKMATKNLDADAIDKVQVFDKKSDRAEFTGIDDGNSSKAINLKLKKDRNNALFGRIAAGVGNNERYDAQTNLNKFNGNQQISLLAMGNNTNKQGFSMNDILNFSGELRNGMRNGGGITIRTNGDDQGGLGLPVTGLGQNQQGIATTFAGGLNYNNSFNKQKTDVNASFTASDVNLKTTRNTKKQYLLPGNNFNNEGNSESNRKLQQQRLNVTIDHKIDSFTSLKIAPSITLQQQNNNSYNTYNSATTTKQLLNEGFNKTSTKAHGIAFVNDFLFRKKFKKKGRTFSISGNINLNHSKQDGSLNTKNTFYTTGFPAKDSLLNQINNTNANTNSFGTSITYTEPIDKRSLLDFSSFYNSTVGKSNRQTFDFNGNSGKFDAMNNLLSNNFSSNYTYSGGSLNYRTNRTKLSFNTGASLQLAKLVSTNLTNNNTIQQSFTDVLPNANIQYKFSSYKTLSINYSTNTQQPTTSQLQPLQNIADPLNVLEGNPNLKRSYAHSINLNFFSADPVTRKNFFAFAAFTTTQNAIVYADDFNANGARVTKPINVNGTTFLFGNINYGFPIKKLKLRADISLGVNAIKNIGLINGLTNNINNTSFNPTISLSYFKENTIDIQASANMRFTKATYSLQPLLNNTFLTQTYKTEIVNYLPFGFVLNNSLNYTINTGRADGFNTSIPFWNSSLAKSFLKYKRLEAKLSVFDVLNRNIGINRNVNQNYIEDLSYNILQRYFLFSLTFRLHKSVSSGGPNVVIRSFNN